ncbi:MAG: hypothetical protein ILO10_02355, partial [Kiritimatiellae bacterium]|nr:hypothetical protein [Kiritimatiellia bacterium]
MTPSPPLSRHPLFTPLLLAAVVLLTALTVTLALLPEPPMFPVLLAAGLALWLPALLLLLHAWNPALAADPLFRYLAAALLVGLEILIFWTILHATVPFLQDVGAHWFSPILYGLLCFPLARILEEYLRRHPAAPPALRILHLWLLAARPMLLFFSLGLVTAGIFFEMHAETPAIDPTFPLAIILPLSLLGILAALARAAAQTAHLRH